MVLNKFIKKYHSYRLPKQDSEKHISSNYFSLIMTLKNVTNQINNHNICGIKQKFWNNRINALNICIVNENHSSVSAPIIQEKQLPLSQEIPKNVISKREE